MSETRFSVSETQAALAHITLAAHGDTVSDISGRSVIYTRNPSANQHNIDLQDDTRGVDVAIRKIVNTPRVLISNQVTYTLSAVNVGDRVARDVVVTDTLPLGFTLVTPLPAGECHCPGPAYLIYMPYLANQQCGTAFSSLLIELLDALSGA